MASMPAMAAMYGDNASFGNHAWLMSGPMGEQSHTHEAVPHSVGLEAAGDAIDVGGLREQVV